MAPAGSSVAYLPWMDEPQRRPSARLISPERAVEELGSGRAVTLRHRTGFSLVAPAGLASAALVEELEATAGSRVALVVERGTRAATCADDPAVLGSPAARAAAVRDVVRGRPHAASAGLAVVEAEPGMRDGSASSSALDLVHAARFESGAIVARVAGDRYEAARTGRLGPRIVCVTELASYLLAMESPVERVVSTALPTPFGEFTMVGYHAPLQDMEFLAAVRGDPSGREGVPVSVHDGCVLGEALRGAACDCRARWLAAWERIGAEPQGIVVRLEPDPASLVEHPETPDPCRIALAVQVIRDLGAGSVRLVATEPAIAEALIEHGCGVVS